MVAVLNTLPAPLLFRGVPTVEGLSCDPVLLQPYGESLLQL